MAAPTRNPMKFATRAIAQMTLGSLSPLTGSALRFRPEPATHQRAMRVRRGASSERSFACGGQFSLNSTGYKRSALRFRVD